MFEHDLTLKANELFLVGEAEDTSGMAAAGLYLRDTRFLRRFHLSMAGTDLSALSVNAASGRTATINMANFASHRLDIDRHTIGVEQRIELDTDLRVTLTVQNFSRAPVTFEMVLELAADFRDMFDIRGWHAKEVGTLLPADIQPDRVVLAIEGPGDLRSATTVAFSPAPDAIEPGPPGHATARFTVDLSSGESCWYTIICTPDPGDDRPVGTIEMAEGGIAFSFRSDDADLQRLVHRGDADLALLQTTFPDGTMPAAGIPWFVAPFGRDSLIVGLQTMHAYPWRVASTLRVLAAHQGVRHDSYTEEQPGKILHEIRYGELARSGQIPHTPYFGSVDATPLFVLTFAQHYLWHRDDLLWDDLVDNVRRALDWMEQDGDLDGDGLLEYTGFAEDHVHISQQGWKDSWDSLHHPDGTAVTGPIALVEVQGYAYAACAQLADAASLRGEDAWARELRERAGRIRETVEDAYWLEDEGFYAQALDGAKRPVRAISSNPGHLLFCGLPSPDRAARVADRLMQPDLFAGWGLRTLSSEMATYNPMSYHNGSIWPHDTSLAMAGLRQYGHDLAALQLAAGLIALGHFDPQARLAELYCGYALAGHENGPVDYPVSCMPQAWAAASAHLVLRTLLGLRLDATHRRLVVDPVLPRSVDVLGVSGLAAFGSRFGIDIEARDGRWHVMPEGEIEIVLPGTILR